MQGRTTKLLTALVLGILLIGANVFINDHSFRFWLNLILILAWSIYFFGEMYRGYRRQNQNHDKSPTKEELLTALERERQSRSETDSQ